MKKNFKSLRGMLTVTILAVAAASVGIGYLVQNYMDSAKKKVYVMQKESTETYLEDVDEKLSSYMTAMGVVSMNKELRDHIYRDDLTRQDMVSVGNDLSRRIREVTFFLYQPGEVISHRLYTHLPADGYFFWDLDEVRNEAWYLKLHDGAPVWWYEYSDLTSTNQLTIANRISSYSSSGETDENDYCAQSITIDTSSIFRPLSDTDGGLFVIDRPSGQIVYNTFKEENKEVEKIYQEIRNGKDIPREISITVRGKKEKIRVLTGEVNQIDAKIVFLFNARKMNKSRELYKIYGTILLLALLMVRLLISIKNEYRARLQSVTAREQALMSCINPHFLYNTLNTVSAMAGMEDADSTVKMVDALSDMFRYSSDITRMTVTLKDELKNVSDYLYIQNIRYQRMFTYKLEVPDELQGCTLPKLILQPVVENAFKHGFRNHMADRERFIHIRARKEKQKLLIAIQDNGEGISAEELKKIKETLQAHVKEDDQGNSKKGHIGLKNVHARIRMQYKGDYGLEINSDGKGKGVCVTLHLPFFKGKGI